MVTLIRTGLFREVDRLTQQFFGANDTTTQPAVMPMDACRYGNDYMVQFKLPRVSPDTIDLDVERNVLTVKAQRNPEFGEHGDVEIAERPCRMFSQRSF